MAAYSFFSVEHVRDVPVRRAVVAKALHAVPFVPLVRHAEDSALERDVPVKRRLECADKARLGQHRAHHLDGLQIRRVELLDHRGRDGLARLPQQLFQRHFVHLPLHRLRQRHALGHVAVTCAIIRAIIAAPAGLFLISSIVSRTE